MAGQEQTRKEKVVEEVKEGDASAITAGGVGEGGGDTDHQSLEGDTSDRETWGDA